MCSSTKGASKPTMNICPTFCSNDISFIFKMQAS
jgi:hypothetical protein